MAETTKLFVSVMIGAEVRQRERSGMRRELRRHEAMVLVGAAYQGEEYLAEKLVKVALSQPEEALQDAEKMLPVIMAIVALTPDLPQRLAEGGRRAALRRLDQEED